MKDKIVLVGKGPTAKKIKKSDEYGIAALNNAVILCEEVDYLFINDIEILDLIDEDQWSKVKMIIIPTYPHYNCGPYKHITHNTLLDKIPIKVEYDVHRLDTCLDNDYNIPYLGSSYSVGTTAIQWLGKNGCKELNYCGIDPDGGYNPIFNIMDKDNQPINHAARAESGKVVYQINYSKFIDIAARFNITLNRI